jgi:hypothetical protein
VNVNERVCPDGVKVKSVNQPVGAQSQQVMNLAPSHQHASATPRPAAGSIRVHLSVSSG